MNLRMAVFMGSVSRCLRVMEVAVLKKWNLNVLKYGHLKSHQILLLAYMEQDTGCWDGEA